MAVMIRCGSCGKRYDYNKDELCPRCGAYTSPSDRQQLMLQAERQLLSGRFRDREADCTPECMPDGYGGHTDRPRQREERPFPPQAARPFPAAAPRHRPTRRTGPEKAGRIPAWGKVLVVLIILLALVLAILPPVLTPIIEERSLTYGVVDGISTLPHSVGETFSSCGITVTVLDWGQLESPEISLWLPEGWGLFYTEVSLSSDGDLPEDLPQVYLAGDGAYYRPLMDSDWWELSYSASDLGYEELSLDSLRYMDAEEGYFLFVAEDGASFYRLCVEELEYNALGWPRVAGVHEVALGAADGKGAAI